MGEIILANSIIEVEILGKGLLSPLETDPVHGDFKRVAGAENVKQCIIDLITTRIGERVMNEDFGTILPDLLFENRDGIVDILPLRIIEAIDRFEPRVRQVTAFATTFEPNGVKTNVSWVLRSTGRPDNLVWPFFFNPAAGGIAAA